MIKSDEFSDPNSCLKKAKVDEMVFVLLARDPDAPGIIRDWITRRIKSGKNAITDKKMIDAELCARIMEIQYAEMHKDELNP